MINMGLMHVLAGYQHILCKCFYKVWKKSLTSKKTNKSLVHTSLSANCIIHDEMN